MFVFSLTRQNVVLKPSRFQGCFFVLLRMTGERFRVWEAGSIAGLAYLGPRGMKALLHKWSNEKLAN
jgi:hypothetical protein